MFYRIQNEKLLDYADFEYANNCLETNIITQTELDEHPDKVIVLDGVLVLNPNYETIEAAQRQADFESKFFNIPGFGWFRKVPKGYSSAVECLNLAFNNVSLMGKLPAETMIFYTQPDFTKPEECTEEWLVAHQIKNAEMTVEQFGQFYAGFSVAWNSTEHN